jgi:hypothetical protein
MIHLIVLIFRASHWNVPKAPQKKCPTSEGLRWKSCPTGKEVSQIYHYMCNDWATKHGILTRQKLGINWLEHKKWDEMVKHLGKLPVLGGGRQSIFTGIENPFCVDSEKEMFFTYHYHMISHVQRVWVNSYWPKSLRSGDGAPPVMVHWKTVDYPVIRNNWDCNTFPLRIDFFLQKWPVRRWIKTLKVVVFHNHVNLLKDGGSISFIYMC